MSKLYRILYVGDDYKVPALIQRALDEAELTQRTRTGATQPNSLDGIGDYDIIIVEADEMMALHQIQRQRGQHQIFVVALKAHPGAARLDVVDMETTDLLQVTQATYGADQVMILSSKPITI